MIPSWWQALLLALAAHRLWRLLAWDELTEPLRLRLVRYNKPRYRADLAHWIQCGWCLGFWVSLAWWGAWQVWQHGTVVAAVPFALSVVVGLLARFDSS